MKFAKKFVPINEIKEEYCLEFLRNEALKIIDEYEPEYEESINHNYVYTKLITAKDVRKFDGDVDLCLRIILPENDENYDSYFPSYEDYLSTTDICRIRTADDLFYGLYIDSNRTYHDELYERFEEWFYSKYITEEENYNNDNVDAEKEELLSDYSGLLNDEDYKPYWKRVVKNIIKKQETAQ